MGTVMSFGQSLWDFYHWGNERGDAAGILDAIAKVRGTVKEMAETYTDPGVYVIFDGDHCVYVGQSAVSVAARLRYHVRHMGREKSADFRGYETRLNDLDVLILSPAEVRRFLGLFESGAVDTYHLGRAFISEPEETGETDAETVARGEAVIALAAKPSANVRLTYRGIVDHYVRHCRRLGILDRDDKDRERVASQVAAALGACAVTEERRAEELDHYSGIVGYNLREYLGELEPVRE